jgi:hypothetical protein
MPTVACQFQLIPSVMAVLTAIFTIFACHAIACGMSTFFIFGHMKHPFFLGKQFISSATASRKPQYYRLAGHGCQYPER